MTGPFFGAEQLSNTFQVLGNPTTPILGMTEQQLLQQICVAVANLQTGGGGGGTVTSFSAVGSNGVTVNVTNPTTTPELTIGLGNITPTRVTVSTAGAASTPPLSLTGAFFTGGSGTTTKPQLLIEPSGVTSSGWNTDGTGLGINAAPAFNGLMADFKLDGVSKLTVSKEGYVFSNVGYGGIFLCNYGGSIMVSFSNNVVQCVEPFRLNNAAAAGTVVPTHTVTLQDSTGTTYRVPCLV